MEYGKSKRRKGSANISTLDIAQIPPGRVFKVVFKITLEASEHCFHGFPTPGP